MADLVKSYCHTKYTRDHRDRDRMVVGFSKNIVENGIKHHSTNPKKYTHVSKM